jgi:stalled ribosome rescue protein Dom34
MKAGSVAALAKVDSMKTEVGVWIDHRKAVIASIAGKTEKTRQVTSNMEKHVRYSRAAQENSAEDQRDRRFTDHLNKYYDEVVAHIRGAESILILGPGEAKTELQERLRNEGLQGRIVGLETVDKMTDRQIAARVRQRFLKSNGKVHELKSLPVA